MGKTLSRHKNKQMGLGILSRWWSILVPFNLQKQTRMRVHRCTRKALGRSLPEARILFLHVGLGTDPRESSEVHLQFFPKFYFETRSRLSFWSSWDDSAWTEINFVRDVVKLGQELWSLKL